MVFQSLTDEDRRTGSSRFRRSAQRHRATHKYQRLTGANAPEPLRLTGNQTLGLAIACSLRVSLQGSGALASPGPTNQHYNQPPVPAKGRPEGHGEANCFVQLPKSSTVQTRLQISCELPGNRFRTRPDCSLQPPENSNQPIRKQPPMPVESLVFCGKVYALCPRAKSMRLAARFTNLLAVSSLAIPSLVAPLRLLGQPAPAEMPTPVAVSCGGDDGLTLQVCDATEKAFKATSDLPLASKERPALYKIVIPTNVVWKGVGERTQVRYAVRVLTPADKEIGAFEGYCWETNVRSCGTQILENTRRLLAPSNRPK